MFKVKKKTWFGLKKQHRTQDTNSGLLYESPGLFDPSTTAIYVPTQISVGSYVTCSERDAEGLTLVVVERLVCLIQTPKGMPMHR